MVRPISEMIAEPLAPTTRPDDGAAMNSPTTRRDLLRAGTHGALTATVFAALSGRPAWADPPKDGGDAATLYPGFPRQDQKLVSEIVGVAHFNEQRVKELVTAFPQLVNAWWDWGFGDWESPLGAASHVGQRGIAEFLLGKGARIDIFAAAMLGFTDVVKAFVTAQPGIQRTLGPHGIPLLAHAKVGGKPAADTLAYLESLGDAGVGLKATPLPADRRRRYLGEFASDRTGLKLACRLNKAGQLVIDVRAGDTQSGNRIIHYAGDDEFFTAGVPGVRVRFAFDGDKAASVTLRGGVPEMTLQRTGG
jgi:hypothetical protein